MSSAMYLGTRRRGWAGLIWLSAVWLSAVWLGAVWFSACGNDAHVRDDLPEAFAVPQNPYLAANGLSNFHHDSYMSDVYGWSGPRSEAPDVKFVDVAGTGVDLRDQIGGQCASQVFVRHPVDGSSLIVSLCFTAANPKLILFDRELNELARLELPQRLSAASGDVALSSLDTSGFYYYVDQADRIVLGAADRTIKVVQVQQAEAGLSLVVSKTIDLQPTLAAYPVPPGALFPENPITGVLPDFQGNLWWVSRYGVVGALPAGWLERNEAMIVAMQLRTAAGVIEEVQNTFAAAAEGVYIVSDHAAYRFDEPNDLQTQQPAWRWNYETYRGSQRKPGMYNQGSGTTPTLLDSGNDRFVVLADNDEPRMNVWVLRRDDAAPVCAVPVFTAGRSASENSIAAYARTLLIDNTYGYTNITDPAPDTEAGVARIDIAADLGKCRRYPDCERFACDPGELARPPCCTVVWQNDAIASTALPKFSWTEPRRVYLYTRQAVGDGSQIDWYFTTLDLDSGALAQQIRIGGGSLIPPVFGDGRAYNNNGSAVTLASDGTAYIGVWEGIVRVADR